MCLQDPVTKIRTPALLPGLLTLPPTTNTALSCGGTERIRPLLETLDMREQTQQRGQRFVLKYYFNK